MSPELKAFLHHFQKNCSVKVIDTIEENHLPHWKRLCFELLNCEEMLHLGQYIKNTFSESGKYSHLQPKIHTYKNELCLTVDVSHIKSKIMKT
jgi:hypothetical protein